MKIKQIQQQIFLLCHGDGYILLSTALNCHSELNVFLKSTSWSLLRRKMKVWKSQKLCEHALLPSLPWKTWKSKCLLNVSPCFSEGAKMTQLLNSAKWLIPFKAGKPLENKSLTMTFLFEWFFFFLYLDSQKPEIFKKLDNSHACYKSTPDLFHGVHDVGVENSNDSAHVHLPQLFVHLAKQEETDRGVCVLEVTQLPYAVGFPLFIRTERTTRSHVVICECS